MNEKTDQQILNEKYRYDPLTGFLYNKKTGKFVGQLSKSGYLTTYYKGRTYPVHRLIFCLHYGYFPENHIDHINRCKVDNRLINIREVTASCNAKNNKLQKNNPSGVTGITKDSTSSNDRWRVIIGHARKQIFIGQFKYFINAVKARQFAEELFGFNICSSVSSASKYLENETNEDNCEEVKREWEFFNLDKKPKIIKKAKHLGLNY